MISVSIFAPRKAALLLRSPLASQRGPETSTTRSHRFSSTPQRVVSSSYRWSESFPFVLCSHSNLLHPVVRSSLDSKTPLGERGFGEGCLRLDLHLGGQFVVGFSVFTFHVLHQATAFTDLFDETTAGGVVFFVHLQVLGELFHFFAQNSDLHLWRTGVGGVGAEFLNDFLLLVWLKHNGSTFFVRAGSHLKSRSRQKGRVHAFVSSWNQRGVRS